MAQKQRDDPPGACAAIAGRSVRYGRWEGSYRILGKNRFSGVLRVPQLASEQTVEQESSRPWSIQAVRERSVSPPPQKQRRCVPRPATSTNPLLQPVVPLRWNAGDHTEYDAYWRKRIAVENLMHSHRAGGILILFQSYYHEVPLASLDRGSPSVMKRRGLNPEKISALRAIERCSTISTRRGRFDAYLEAARAIDAADAAASTPDPNTPPHATHIKWSHPSIEQRRKRFLGVQIVRIALQDHTFRASQVAVAGLDTGVPCGDSDFAVGQSAMHQRVVRMNQYVHPIPSNSGLLSTLGVSDRGFVREWCALFKTVGFWGLRATDWDKLTKHIKKHVLIIRDDPVRPFFLAIAEGVTRLHVPRMVLQLSANPSWGSGFDAICFEPPKGLTILTRAEYLGARSRQVGEKMQILVDGVTSRADRATPYRVRKRDADYDSDDEQLSFSTRYVAVALDFIRQCVDCAFGRHRTRVRDLHIDCQLNNCFSFVRTDA